MKSIAIEGHVIETQGTGMLGKYSIGDVEFQNGNGEWLTLTDTMYKEFLGKQVRITVEVME